MTANDKTAIDAVKHLSSVDPVMAKLTADAGPYPIRPHHDYFQELVDSIISQQLSVSAASTIEKRFCALFGSDKFPEAAQISSKSPEELKSAGLSRPKVKYIQDLAAKVVDGTVKFDHFIDLTNQQIVDELTAVNGIGVWTVHMFLLFCMGRMDVLAYGDLAIKTGIARLYGLKHIPDQAEVEKIADKKQWHPYSSAACWCIWSSLKKPTIA